MSFNTVSGGNSSSSWSSRRQCDEWENNPKFCACEGKKCRASLMTSWTEDNPGRRFYGCRNWKTKNCGYFDWMDEPMSERAKEVINDLERENLKLLKFKESSRSSIDVDSEIAKLWDVLQALKEESRKIRKKSRFMTYILLGSWLMFVYFALA
ncbi:uncharacterized protein LOC131005819 [Salvia miltiorrhiza]|uniref:uncharacterized protein LOC131005819 n=1 Tax=Salvia miltiorrhiza TaxID=226208 RepID=UPI0025ACB875|nr:uncharacterized protein LOC131005819 [Salvia miltiorrhiza]